MIASDEGTLLADAFWAPDARRRCSPTLLGVLDVVDGAGDGGADDIRGWFLEAPANITKALDDLIDSMRARYINTEAAAYLGLTVA